METDASDPCQASAISASSHVSPLPEADVSKLRQWIKEGAKWQEHWAFVKPVAVPPPAVKRHDWPKNPIDHFVLARLEAGKLQPNPEAEAALLLRRLSIDLTGLPPTLAELDAFEAAWKTDPESAWQREIDRLIASPHYGERWASIPKSTPIPSKASIKSSRA